VEAIADAEDRLLSILMSSGEAHDCAVFRTFESGNGAVYEVNGVVVAPNLVVI
jgi:hypothetical protein